MPRLSGIRKSTDPVWTMTKKFNGRIWTWLGNSDTKEYAMSSAKKDFKDYYTKVIFLWWKDTRGAYWAKWAIYGRKRK